MFDMKKKVSIIIAIILVLLVLLFPVPTNLNIGSRIEFKSLLYSITKYYELIPMAETDGLESNEWISIKVLGFEVYNNKKTSVIENNLTENNQNQPVEDNGNQQVVIKHSNITNLQLLDEFLENTDKYNQTPISSEVQIVRYTTEGDETIATLKYDKEKDEFTLINDYTKDRYGVQEIVTKTYSNSEYDLKKKIRGSYIDIVLVPDKNSNEELIEEVIICAYKKNLEKNKDLDRVKVNKVSFVEERVHTDKLVKYNGVLYCLSDVIMDYAGNPNGPIGTINKLIGEEFLPTLNGETNSEELLNALVDDANENNMVLDYNNECVLFKAVNLIKSINNVSLSIKEGTLTKTGATVIITDNNKDTYIYGESFRIDKKENGEWKKLEIIDDTFGFTDIAWSVGNNGKLERKHDWSKLYGELAEGEYRLVKDVYDNGYKEIWVEFNI